MVRHGKLILVLLVAMASSSLSRPNEFYKRRFKIPNKLFDGSTEKVCTAQPVEANQFLVEFEPLLDKVGVINHLSVGFCDEPYSDDFIWACGEGRHCKAGTPKIQGAFNWAREAGGWKLPEDIGIPTGNRSRYILFLVHSAHVFNADDTSETGVEVTIRNSAPTYKAGIYVLGNVGRIPPNVKDYYTDSACEWKFNTTVFLFAFTIHTHARGKAVSGYINRNKVWHEIGRGQALYPEGKMDITYKRVYIQPGDVVVSRCIFDNTDDRYVPFSHKAEDEMCNFWIHFAYQNGDDDLLRYNQCAADAESFHLQDHFSAIPRASKDTSVSPDQKYKIEHDHWRKLQYHTSK